MIDISSQRELFVDDYLINKDKTTAEQRLHVPVRRGVTFEFDSPWEGSNCGYPCVFFAEGKWRMYYRASCYDRAAYICYAESHNGTHWIKPSLGIVEFEGSRANNIIFDFDMLSELGFKTLDNLFVFYDSNPECPAKEKYKMVMMWCGNGALLCLTSGDGLHFKKSHVLTRDGEFDSQNVAFFSAAHGKYYCYFRGEHTPDKAAPQIDISYSDKVAAMIYDPYKGAYKEPGAGDRPFVRDVRVMESTDFKSWSEPKQIVMNGDDYQLYTSGINPYPRAPHIFFGFPNRYVERKYWSPAFEELCGKEDRLRRMKSSPRGGLAINDTMFMASRDGYNFTRYEEAFLPPPPECPEAFVYGDGYISHGLIEVPSEVPGAENEYMLLVNEGYRSYERCNRLAKYTIRLDGFVSMHAGGEAKVLTTKEFTYCGEVLHVNIATSARHPVYFVLTDRDGNKYASHEVFGNSTDKRVHFLDEDAVAKLSGKPVTLEVMLHDADLYAIRFD